jgi:uncharacterized tellurite resistance protein B-like protein
MRTYPNNSPQSAARIVILAMLADGHLSQSELDVLDKANAYPRLGLSREDLHTLMHTFCEDLLCGLPWADAHRFKHQALSSWLNEVDNTELRLTVLQLCAQVMEADRHLADEECHLLTKVLEQWGLDCSKPALNMQAQHA